MARVLVLGGTGFVGPFVVRELLAAGHDVLVFHRGRHEPALVADAEHVHGEFDQLHEFVAHLARWRPDIVLDVNPGLGKSGHGVLHFAAVAERSVVLTSHDVYRAMEVLWGSAAGGVQDMPVDEEAALRTEPSPDLTNDLEFDNLDVERASRGVEELPATILRLPIVYGPLDPQRRLRGYVRRMDDGRTTIVLDSRLANLRLSRGYVENVAAAVARAVADVRARGRTYNVSEHALSESEWVREIADACGWAGEILAVESAELPSALRVELPKNQHLYSTGARLRGELDFREPVPRCEGLVRSIEWERAQAKAEPPPDYSAEDQVLSGRNESPRHR